MSGGLEPRASVAVGLLRSLESRLCWVLRKPSVEQAGAKGMSFSVFSQREGRERVEGGEMGRRLSCGMVPSCHLSGL